MDATPAALEWRVEETCLSAWPALQEVLFDGWLLRFSEGLTRRANSANPLRPLAHADLPTCEVLYRRQKLPTIFRVLSLIAPSVDEQLASAGYTDEGDSCVLYGGIDEIETGPDPNVRLLSKPNPEWFGAMAALQNHTIEQASIYQRIVGQIAIPASFVALFANGEVVALAYERLTAHCYAMNPSSPTGDTEGRGMDGGLSPLWRTGPRKTVRKARACKWKAAIPRRVLFITAWD